MQLLLRLSESEQTPAQIAAEFGMTLIDLAHWVADPEHSAALGDLIRLHEARAHMMLSSVRAKAAARLANLAIDDANSETCRKACVDLLRADPTGSANQAADTRASLMQPPPAPTEAMILRALGESGARELESYQDDDTKDDQPT